MLTACRCWITVCLLLSPMWFGISGCSAVTRTISDEAPALEAVARREKQTVIWTGKFSGDDPAAASAKQRGWLAQWQARERGAWGLQNLQVLADPEGRFTNILRVSYPAGSASPVVSRKGNAPVGGAQFYASLGMAPQTALRLSYYVRFSQDFDFVKGGKLPGLFGGKGNNGGNTPDGSDGFSTRFMWRRNGAGEVYAYLPTSRKRGTSIERGAWRFRPGVWHHLEQEIVLNQPQQQNGRIQVWLDGKRVIDENGLTFRTVDTLKIEGIFFSTFFGGNDASWATPKDVYVDFAEFSVSSVSS